MQNTNSVVVLQRVSLFIALLCLTGCGPKTSTVSPHLDKDPNLCDFKRGACIKTVDNMELTLSITPWNAPSEQALTLKLSSASAIENVTVRIEGRDMFMGIIPVHLTQTTKNHYQAPLIYGSCSSGYMVWQAIVSYKQAGHDKFAVFEFLADSDKHTK